MHKPTPLVIFDMAGTTVQDNNDVARCFQQALRTLNCEFSMEEINTVMGWDKMTAIETLFRKRMFKVRDFFEELMLTHYSKNAREIHGATATFRMIRSSGGLVALNTGFPRVIANAIIKCLKWESEINISVTSDEVEQGRPHPDMIEAIQGEALDYEMFNLEESSSHIIIKFGDTISDIQEGINANCEGSFGVCTGAYTRDQLEKYVWDHTYKGVKTYGGTELGVIENIQEAPKVIGRLVKEYSYE